MDGNQTGATQGGQYQQQPQYAQPQQPAQQLQYAQPQRPAQQPAAQYGSQYGHVPQAPVAPPQATTQALKGSWPKLVLGFALFWVCVVAQGLAVLVAYALTDETLLLETVYEVSSAVIALAIFSVLGGWRWLRLDDSKVVAALRDCWWLILLDCGLLVVVVYEAIADGDSLIDGWLMQVLVTAVMCLGIGLCEEGMFRGILHNSFLARFGRTRRSVVWCAVISATIFGLFHVLPADESDLTTLGIVQMVLKTVQTGICGFVWAIIATRDEDLWGVAIVHGLSDFLLIAPDVAFGYMDSALSTEYVTTDDEAMTTIVFYLITIVAYLPLIIRSARIIRKMDAPRFGAYVKAAPQLAAVPMGYAPTPVPYGYAPAQQGQVAYGYAPTQQGQAATPSSPTRAPYAAATQQPQQAYPPQAQTLPAQGSTQQTYSQPYPQTGQQSQQVYQQPSQQAYPQPYPQTGQQQAGGPPRPSGL